jgi:hypothetical protein
MRVVGEDEGDVDERWAVSSTLPEIFTERKSSTNGTSINYIIL